MVQKSNDAAVKDAQTSSSREEFAEGMGQRSRSNDVAAMVVLTSSLMEEFA